MKPIIDTSTNLLDSFDLIHIDDQVKNSFMSSNIQGSMVDHHDQQLSTNHQDQSKARQHKSESIKSSGDESATQSLYTSFDSDEMSEDHLHTRRSRRSSMTVQTLYDSLNDYTRNECLESARRRLSLRLAKTTTGSGPIVRFDQVQVREYPIIIGDNPAVTKGPALTIDWEHFDTDAVGFEEYESARPERRSKDELEIPSDIRWEILKNCGFSSKEIRDMVKIGAERRCQRQMTNSMAYRDDKHESIEKWKRRFKNIFTNKKSKERKFMKESEKFQSGSTFYPKSMGGV